MTCLDNIVTLGACGDEEESISGFRLTDAAGISAETLAKIADADTHTGAALAMSKKRIAILKVKNDFTNVMSANAITADISKNIYSSGEITSGSAGLSDQYRGAVIHKVNTADNIRKTYLKTITFVPMVSGTVILRIEDGNTISSYNVAVTGGSINSIDTKTLTGGGYIPILSKSLKVLALNDVIPFQNSQITCLKGCGGSTPNPCAWVDGWTGIGATKTNGYGFVFEFFCDCDYNEVLCGLSDTIIGELVFLAWQIEIMQEHLFSSRFNNIVVYGHEEIKDYWLPQLQSEYRLKWNALADNFKNILSRFNSSCVKCKGIKWVTNL